MLTLLDTGPLVSFFDKSDSRHPLVIERISKINTPFKTCEAVITETCFLLKRLGKGAVEDLFELGQRGVYQIDFSLNDNIEAIRTLLSKYKDISISLADACLIRMAELHEEDKILTFDSDFEIYRWGQNRKFKILK